VPDHPDLVGLVDRSTGRAVLTVRGRLLANAVTTRLLDDERVGTTGRGAPVTVAGATGSAGTIPPYA